MVWFSLRVREVPSSILGMPPIFSIFFPYSVVAINLLLIVHQEKMINEDHTRGKFLSCYLLLSYCCLIQKGWNTNPNANWLIKYLIQIQYRNWIETGQSKSIYYYTCQTLKFPDSKIITSQFVLLSVSSTICSLVCSWSSSLPVGSHVPDCSTTESTSPVLLLSFNNP